MGKKIANDKHQKAPMNKNTKNLVYALAGSVFLVMAILIIIENTPNKLIVKNKTGKNLEYVKAYFVDDEGQLTKAIEIKDLKIGETAEFDLEKLYLTNLEAVFEIRFKFEGYDELFTDTGYFNDVFDGKITISFTDTDNDKVLLNVKATTGILTNPNIICDEEYTVNLEEGYVEE